MDDDIDVEMFLLKASDRCPLEALDLISQLPDDGLPVESIVLYAKFNAMRHLATDRLYTNCQQVDLMKLHEVESLFGPDEIQWACQALGAIAELEGNDPEFLVEHDFVEGLIDQVGMPLDRVRPGQVQELLGWTKLGFFGHERILVAAPLLDDMPDALVRTALMTRIEVPDRVTAAIAVYIDDDAKSRSVDSCFCEGTPLRKRWLVTFMWGTCVSTKLAASNTHRKRDRPCRRLAAPSRGSSHPSRRIATSSMLAQDERKASFRSLSLAR